MKLFLYTGSQVDELWTKKEFLNNPPEEFNQSQNFENQDSIFSSSCNLDQSVFTCLLCGKVYTWLYSLKRHQMKCGNKEAQYNCPLCKKKYFRIDSLKYHQETKHNRYEYKRRRKS